MYQVTTATPLRSEPDDDAPVVIQLRSGIKIRVVGAAGDYLEVRSKKGRTPGYVLKDHVVLIQPEKEGEREQPPASVASEKSNELPY
jgi:hypothetical protein